MLNLIFIICCFQTILSKNKNNMLDIKDFDFIQINKTSKEEVVDSLQQGLSFGIVENDILFYYAYDKKKVLVAIEFHRNVVKKIHIIEDKNSCNLFSCDKQPKNDSKIILSEIENLIKNQYKE